MVVEARRQAVHGADEGPLAAAHHAEPDAPAPICRPAALYRHLVTVKRAAKPSVAASCVGLKIADRDPCARPPRADP
jgi:hypothetical protein